MSDWGSQACDCTLLVVSVRKPQLPHETKVDETQTFVQTRRAMLALGICIQADPFASVLGHGNQFTKSAHVCCSRSSHTDKMEKCTYPATRIFLNTHKWFKSLPKFTQHHSLAKLADNGFQIA